MTLHDHTTDREALSQAGFREQVPGEAMGNRAWALLGKPLDLTGIDEGRTYFRVNAPHCDDRKLRDSDITEVASCFAETDDRTIPEQLEWIESLGQWQPQVQVFTGGKSIHCYWLLDAPTGDLESWRRAQAGLIKNMPGADGSIKNPSRLMAHPLHPYADGSRCWTKVTDSPRRTLAEIQGRFPAPVSARPFMGDYKAVIFEKWKAWKQVYYKTPKRTEEGGGVYQKALPYALSLTAAAYDCGFSLQDARILAADVVKKHHPQPGRLVNAAESWSPEHRTRITRSTLAQFGHSKGMQVPRGSVEKVLDSGERVIKGDPEMLSQLCLEKAKHYLATDRTQAMAMEVFREWYRAHTGKYCSPSSASTYFRGAYEETFSTGEMKEGAFIGHPSPSRYIVKDLLCKGGNIMVASPKVGKTRLALRLLRAWLDGAPEACGKEIETATQAEGRSLLIIGPDQDEAMWCKYLHGSGLAKDGRMHPRARLLTFVPGGASALARVCNEWYEKNPNGLVMIDSLSAAVNGNVNFNNHEIAWWMRTFKADCKPPWLILHHANKAAAREGVKGESLAAGSGQITAVPDHVVTLKKNREAKKLEVTCEGREGGDADFMLDMADFSDVTPSRAEVRRSIMERKRSKLKGNQATIMEYFESQRPGWVGSAPTLHKKGIQGTRGNAIAETNLYSILRCLADKGFLERSIDRTGYVLADLTPLTRGGEVPF